MSTAKPIEIYQYPNCSTCRKALKWLDAQRVATAASKSSSAA
jgi:arsenate reductase (glutaredoxin)